MRLRSKIDRLSSWILLVSIILYIITGFDIQGRFLSPQISSLLHLKYLFLPAEAAFAYHASFAMSRAFNRWRMHPRLSVAFIMIFVLLNIALTFYYLYIQFLMK